MKPMDPLSLEKNRLRTAFRRSRDAMPAADRAEADAQIARRLNMLPAFADADLILTYCSFGSEVDTTRIIQDALAQGKRVALPRVTGPHQMEWHFITDLDALVESEYGILEPSQDGATLVRFEQKSTNGPVALVPGLAFDQHGYRLGYGGGFYDRFLPEFFATGGTALGLCRDQTFVPSPLPHDAHDARVNGVVTESLVVCIQK